MLPLMADGGHRGVGGLGRGGPITPQQLVLSTGGAHG